MIQSALSFLITTLAYLLTLTLLLRFLFQLFKVPFHNQFSQMVFVLTDFIVKPARKIIPSWRKLDLSTLTLAFLVQLISQDLLAFIQYGKLALTSHSWFYFIAAPMLALINMLLDIFFYALLLQAILSFINPNTPISGILNKLTRPILRPIQKWIPPVNSFDFSILIAMILLQMINISVIHHSKSYLNSVF